MNFSQAAATGRAIKLSRFDVDSKKLVEVSGWLELQPNGFLIDRETGSQFYPEGQDYISENWKVEEETVKVTAKKVVELFKSFIYALQKKDIISLTDGVSSHDLAHEFVKKFDFKELPETFAVVSEKDYEF